jgi:hypothetical protein
MGRSFNFLTLLALLGLVLCTGPTRSFASENCLQLETLSQQYAGVELTVYQKQIKRRLVAWYVKNCHGRRSAEAN